MEIREVQTSRGVVPIWGRWSDFSPERPLLVVIRGAFPPAEYLTGLPDIFPQADIAFIDLPGMGAAPLFEACSVRIFAGAFDQAIDQSFPDRAINALGLSIGGVVAFGLRSPWLRAILAVDPPLTTAGLWPLEGFLQDRLVDRPHLKPWIWAVFGIGEDGVAPRDHSPVLDGLTVPTQVLLASDPLEPKRNFARQPSLVSEADRELYRRHPKVNVQVVPDTGHNIAADNPAILVQSLRAMLPPSA